MYLLALAGNTTWCVDWIVLKTPIFTWGDDHPTVLPETVEKKQLKTFTLQLHPTRGIVIVNVQCGEERRFSYDNIHSFQAYHSLFWFTTCACGTSSAALLVFLVSSGETACLTLLKELRQCMLLHSKQSHKSTLLPSKGHVATVYVDRHWHCIFPRHLDPLKIGKRLSESMLPLCSGIKDYLCITRRTGNTALLRDHVPIDFIEKYAPKGAYPRMPCAAKDVCVPPVVMPRSLPISKEAEHGANAACLSPTSVVSEVYLHLHAPGAMTPLPGPYSVDVHTAGQSDTENCAASLSDALDSYTFMAPAYLELLPEGDTVPLGPPHQLLLDGAVLDTREAELPVDTGPLGPPHQLLLDGAVLDTRDFTIFGSVLEYYLELFCCFPPLD